MKIAVSYDESNQNVYYHFGETPAFKIYNAENRQITDASVTSTGSVSHGALVTLLSEWNIDVLICGRIGQGAQNKLDAAGIDFYGGVSGNADEAVQSYLQGTLNYSVHNDDHGLLS